MYTQVGTRKWCRAAASKNWNSHAHSPPLKKIFSTKLFKVKIQYVPANAQPCINACAASQYCSLVKNHSFWWCYLVCFQNQMLQTRPDFVLILAFYHNFSITSPKKVPCKILAMLKTHCIFIIEHYLHSHYWTKMSDTFTFNRTELEPIRQNKP